MIAAVASTAVMTMLAMSQKPERVSNILRSSTPTRRVSGMRAAAACRRPVVVGVVWSRTAVVMPRLLHAGSLR